MEKEKIKKMIQERLKMLVKESQPVTVSELDWKSHRKRIDELDWVLTLFN